MILNLNNEIDVQLSENFSKEEIDNVNIANLDYFGMDLLPTENSGIQYKFYYLSRFSDKQYEKQNDVPFVNYVSGEMKGYLSIVHDHLNKGCNRFDIRIHRKHRSDEEMLQLFSWLDSNVGFFKDYKEEIMRISTMKTVVSQYKYASLFFVGGIVDELKNISLLKCHWANMIEPKYEKEFPREYYIDFLKNCNVKGFNDLLPITEKLFKVCGGKFCMEGIDYCAEGRFKHKIYFVDLKNLYEGLSEIFEFNPEITKKISMARDWHCCHPEFYCDGIAIGIDSEQNYTLNLYYTFRKRFVSYLSPALNSN